MFKNHCFSQLNFPQKKHGFRTLFVRRKTEGPGSPENPLRVVWPPSGPWIPLALPQAVQGLIRQALSGLPAPPAPPRALKGLIRP